MLLVFFFKQMTAYEMRISDWSSDVCSSDLITADTVRKCLPGSVDTKLARGHCRLKRTNALGAVDHIRILACGISQCLLASGRQLMLTLPIEIGRASCRERVCP